MFELVLPRSGDDDWFRRELINSMKHIEGRASVRLLQIGSRTWNPHQNEVSSNRIDALQFLCLAPCMIWRCIVNLKLKRRRNWRGNRITITITTPAAFDSQVMPLGA
jgi:hypothetical protein